MRIVNPAWRNPVDDDPGETGGGDTMRHKNKRGQSGALTPCAPASRRLLGVAVSPIVPPRSPRRTLPISQELADLLAPRIMRNVVKRRSGCWIRTAYVNPSTGYTAIARTVAGKKTYYLAHRVMYVSANGPIPDGLEIDHICEVVACCNPRHLRAVTHRANIYRSKKNPYAVNARKTECVNGHKLPPFVEGGSRKCEICPRERVASARERRRALRLKEPSVMPIEKHGTQGGYHYWSCRCAECKAWQHNDYLRRKALGDAA